MSNTFKSIEDVLNRLVERTYWTPSAVEDRMASEEDRIKFVNECKQSALKDIETLVNGAVGGKQEHAGNCLVLITPPSECDCGANGYNYAHENIRTNLDKVMRSSK